MEFFPMPDENPARLDYNIASSDDRSRVRSRQGLLVFQWFGLCSCAACAAMMLWAARLPVSNFIILALGLLAGAAGGLVWLITASIAIKGRKLAESNPRGRGILLMWLPLILLLGVWIILELQIPRMMVFHANEKAMNIWVAQVLAVPGPPPNFARVGSYSFYNIEAIPGGVKVLVEGCGFFRGSGGFAFSPNGIPLATGPADETFTPIGGGWYIRTYDES